MRRNEEFTITDAAKEDNKSDDISLSKFNINYSSLIGAGFTNLYIYIEMDIKELDDGYQEIYICNGSKTLWEQELEHGGTKKEDRKSTRLNSSHWNKSRMPSSA